MTRPGLVITCEHGGNHIPGAYRHLFQGQEAVLQSHRGFDPGAAPRSAYGLVGMRFRVEAEGGRLDVVSAPRRGTTIRLSLPELAAA